jgi:hypothetical protein
MPSHINFNLTLDIDEFLNVFNRSKKNVLNNFDRIQANLPDDAHNIPMFKDLIDQFSFIPKNRSSIDLFQFVGNSRPHINAGNNGLLIFPLAGSFLLNFYSYVTPTTDEDGRPTMDQKNMSPEELAAIESTKIESITVSSPIAIDGLTTLSLHNNGSNAVVLVLKIDKYTSWETVTEFFNNV